MSELSQPSTRPVRWMLFNLVYLLFYFPEWLWRAPGVADLIAISVALAVFLPLYWLGFDGDDPPRVGTLLGMEAIALALSPFSGLQGVFHIYACVQAGFLRPGRRAVVWIAGLTLFYAAFIVLVGPDRQDWINAGFALFFGVITGVGCISSAESMEREQLARRSETLARQHATLAERERIASDLHDVLGHTLTMVALKSEVAEKLVNSDPERAREEIRTVGDAARRALKDIRATVYDMTFTTVENELALAGRALSAANVALQIEGQAPTLDARQSKALGLTIREATTNIVRHSRASEASIRIDDSGDRIQLTIADNGIESAADEGHGLQGLRHRIQALGGRVSFGRKGADRVRVLLPLTAGEHGAGT